MATYLYLCMTPESLVASMLPPEEFGTYLAVGTKKRTRGQAIFFELASGFTSDYFDLSNIDGRCVAHPDGEPKHSVYLAIYRVLEHVPPEALRNLYLVTAHGRVLQIAPAAGPPATTGRYHLYQELCPVHPLIASALGPQDFGRFITDRSRPIWVPRICFVELALGDLASDPAGGSARDLPYPHIDHLRNCLLELEDGKQAKTVDRIPQAFLLYRCVHNGLFVADQQAMRYYPYPQPQDMEDRYYEWWRCANDSEVDLFAMKA